MTQPQSDSVGEFRRYLATKMQEIEGLDRIPFLPSGEAYLRRCAEIIAEVGVQALRTGFVDLHKRSLVIGDFAERKVTLYFLVDCASRCNQFETADLARKEVMMTSDDVAEMLGITTRSVRRRVLDGTLPKPVRLGRSVRFRRKDIEAVAVGKQV